MDEQANPARTGTTRDAFPARRDFLKILTTATGSLLALTTTPGSSKTSLTRLSHLHLHLHLHLQDCRIAGSHHYDCHEVLARLRPGDRLSLRRQPDNSHNARAIEFFWRRHKPGYLPRLDNAAAASLVDRNHIIHARILATDAPEDAWEPVQLHMWATTTPRRNHYGI